MPCIKLDSDLSILTFKTHFSSCSLKFVKVLVLADQYNLLSVLIYLLSLNIQVSKWVMRKRPSFDLFV